MPDEYITFRVDTGTGEAQEVTGGYYVSPEQAEQRRRRAQEIREQQLRELANSEHNRLYGSFTFLKYRQSEDIWPDTAPNDIAKLFYLSTFLSYNSNILKFSNGRLISSENLKELLRVSDSTCRRFLMNMEQKNFLQVEGETIRISSALFARQNIRRWQGENFSFIRIYHRTYKYLDGNLPIRQHSRLGYLIKLIPYLNIKKNIICSNPQEAIAESIIPLNGQSICRILNYTNNQTSRLLRDLSELRLENNQPVFVYDGELQAGIINPLLFYGGSNWNDVLQRFQTSLDIDENMEYD